MDNNSSQEQMHLYQFLLLVRVCVPSVENGFIQAATGSLTASLINWKAVYFLNLPWALSTSLEQPIVELQR